MINKENRQFDSFTGGIFYTLLLLIMFIMSGIFQGVVGIFAERGTKVFSLVCSLATPLSLVILSVFISIFFKSEKKEIFPFKKFSLLSGVFALLIGVSMIFAFGFINGMIGRWLKSLGLNVPDFPVIMDSGLDFFLYVLCFALLPAVCEELFFRGAVIKSLYGDNKFSICVLNGFLFALYHCSLVQFVYQFIYGFVLAMLFMYSKSLFPTILVHFLNNFIVLCMEFFDFSLPFSNLTLIITGLVIMAVVVTFMVLKITKDIRADKVRKEKSCVKFIIPFGLLGMIACVAIMISNLFVVAV